MTRGYDRIGEPIEDDVDPTAPAHDPRCRRGWLPDAHDGRAVPCPFCKPHLADRRAHVRRVIDGPHR